MKTLTALAIIALGILLGACNLQPVTPAAEPIETQATGWVQLGTTLDINASQSAIYPSLSLDSSGNPVISWMESDGISNNIYVKRWNGSSWIQLGATLDVNINQDVNEPSLALDSSGNPVVSWTECLNTACTNTDLYVKRWNGTSWVQLGTNLDATTNHSAYQPSLALDSSGNPVISWMESDGISNNIYVKRWNGSSWIQLGGFLDIDGNQNSYHPSLALDSLGNPVVSWTGYESVFNNNANIYVKRWNGTSWVQLGATLDVNTNQDAYNPSLALDNSGNPVVSWNEDESQHTNPNIYVKRWNGTSWVQLGTFLDVNSNQIAYQPSLALDSLGNPVVGWDECNLFDNIIEFCVERKVYVKRWNGSNWILMGGILDTLTMQLDSYPNLDLNNSGNPVVSWNKSDGTSYNIYVKRYSTTAWQPLGTSLDNNNAATRKSAITRTSTNRPVVAWEEYNTSVVPNNYNIYVKQWSGTTWQSLGSALDQVIGNSSTLPSIAMRTDNRPVVAWSEFSFSAVPHITYVKRWDGAAWVAVGTAISTGFESYPVVALDATNTPYLAWRDFNAAQNLYRVKVAKLSGNAWVGITGAVTPTTVFASANIGYLSFALDSMGKPSVAAIAGTNNSLLVRQWNGAAWVARGGTVASQASEVSLAVLSTGLPIVSYQALVGSNFNVYVKQWNATTNTWQSYGTTVNALGTNGFRPQLRVDTNNIPYVVYEEHLLPARSVFVKRFVSGAWKTIASKVDDDLVVTSSDAYPSIVLKTNNWPMVAWTEYAGPANGFNNTYVKQY